MDILVYFVVAVESCILFATFYVTILRDKLKNFTKRHNVKQGFYITIDHFDLGVKTGTLTNLSIDALIDKLTGALPKHDLNSMVKVGVERAIYENINEIIEKHLDGDTLQKFLAEKIDSAFKDALDARKSD